MSIELELIEALKQTISAKNELIANLKFEIERLKGLIPTLHTGISTIGYLPNYIGQYPQGYPGIPAQSPFIITAAGPGAITVPSDPSTCGSGTITVHDNGIGGAGTITNGNISSIDMSKFITNCGTSDAIETRTFDYRGKLST